MITKVIAATLALATFGAAQPAPKPLPLPEFATILRAKYADQTFQVQELTKEIGGMRLVANGSACTASWNCAVTDRCDATSLTCVTA